MIDPKFFHDNKQFWRSKKTLIKGGEKTRLQAQAEFLVKNYDPKDLIKVWEAMKTDLFFDVCDMIRVDEALAKENKTYDNYPLDLVELFKTAYLLTKKQ